MYVLEACPIAPYVGPECWVAPEGPALDFHGLPWVQDIQERGFAVIARGAVGPPGWRRYNAVIRVGSGASDGADWCDGDYLALLSDEPPRAW